MTNLRDLNWNVTNTADTMKHSQKSNIPSKIWTWGYVKIDILLIFWIQCSFALAHERSHLIRFWCMNSAEEVLSRQRTLVTPSKKLWTVIVTAQIITSVSTSMVQCTCVSTCCQTLSSFQMHDFIEHEYIFRIVLLVSREGNRPIIS